jgi:putative adhesin
VVRTLTARRSGPVLVAVNLPAGSVNIVSDPDTTTAEVQLRATTDDPALNDAIERAVLRWDDAGALMVSVPELPATSHTVVHGRGATTVVQNLGTVSAGTVITGAVISGNVVSTGGRIVVDGVTVAGPGTVIVGTIEVVATVPEGCNIEVRGTAADLTAAGEFDTITTRTVSGDVRVDATHTLTATTTSGHVTAAAVDTTATVKTVSGGIDITAFAGTATLNTVSGSIQLGARHAAGITARSVSGNVAVTATDRAIAAGVSVQANSVSGRVTTPTTPQPTTRRTGRVGGEW